MPEPQLMTTRLMIRLNSIRIFSKVGDLGQGVYIRFGKSGGLSLRDEVDISYWKYYTTSPPSKVASRGVGYISSKRKGNTLSRSPLLLLLYHLFSCSFSFLFSLTILSILYLLQPNSSYLSLSVLISSLSISLSVCSG